MIFLTRSGGSWTAYSLHSLLSTLLQYTPFHQPASSRGAWRCNDDFAMLLIILFLPLAAVAVSAQNSTTPTSTANFSLLTVILDTSQLLRSPVIPQLAIRNPKVSDTQLSWLATSDGPSHNGLSSRPRAITVFLHTRIDTMLPTRIFCAWKFGALPAVGLIRGDKASWQMSSWRRMVLKNGKRLP